MAIDNEPTASAPVTLFSDDVVSNNNDPSRIGVITRTAVEDEEDEDDYDDERGEDEQADEDRIPPDHARVLWLPPDLWLPNHPAAAQAEQERATGFSSVVHVHTLSLVDRSLLHGDVVVRSSDSLGQMGHVVDVSVLLDLTLSATRTLTSVPSTRLSFIHPFQSGVYVTANNGLWLGFVDECWCDVSLRFPDGSECTVAAAGGRDLRDPRHSDDMMVEESKNMFYPGQELTGRSAVWKQAEWHKGNKSSPARFNHTGVVYRIRPARVLVQWVTGPGQEDEETVATDVDLNETPLKVLSCYEQARMMLGDRVMLSDELMREKFGEEEAKSASESKAAESLLTDGSEAAAEDGASESVVAGGGKKLTANEKRRLKRARATQRRQQSEQQDEGRRCALITRSRTTVSILWQNGVREDNIPSISLLPRTDLIDNDFMPTDYVLVRGSQRLATVLYVNPTDRTCRVRWLDPIADDMSVPFPAEENEADGGSGEADADILGPRRAGEEAEVSIFDVVAHPRLELSLSSHVVRMPGAEESVPRPNQDVVFGTAGQVIGFQEGLLRVQWADADNTVSVVQADQVWNVDQAEAIDEEEYGDEDEYAVDEDGNPIDVEIGMVPDDELDERDRGGIAGVLNTWISAFTGGAGGEAPVQERRTRRGGATVEEIPSGEEDEQVEEDEDGEVEEERDEHEDDEEDTEDEEETEEDDTEDEDDEEEEEASKAAKAPANYSTTPSAAAQPATLDAASSPPPTAAEASAQSSTVGSSGHTVLGSTALYSLFFGKATTASASVSDTTTATPNTADTASEAKDAAADSAVESIDLQSLYSRPPTSAAVYASFTVLPNPTSHYFLTTPFPTSPPSSFSKKVRSDIRLLRLHLPAGIHVLTYEGRLDLLRAVIVGPRWTPFYSSLFMFDIHLPHSYPAVPPNVHYYSHGLRLHPNLYVEGKVCLSLLNTWNGRTNERWQPESTTLLQVLLSLQGLVLGDSEPFYLEAGLERLRGETQSVVSSVQYSETSVLYSLQSDVSALQHVDSEWMPLLLSHYAAPAIRDVFGRLNEYARVLKAHTEQPATTQSSEEKDVDEERKAAIKALFHHFSLPLGKSLLPRGKAAATPASEAKEAASVSHAEEEKKTADGTARAAVDGSKPSMIYMPSVGFLRSLTRDVTKLCTQLDKIRLAWDAAVASAASEAQTHASS